MRKAILMTLVLALIVGALTGPAAAGKKKKKPKKPKRVEREISGRYEAPWGVVFEGSGVCAGCPSFPNEAKETWVKVEVSDDQSPTAQVSFNWDSNGDGVADTGINVCGSTDGFVEIPGGITPTAFPSLVGGVGCPGSAATSGSVKVTYSNMPEPGGLAPAQLRPAPLS